MLEPLPQDPLQTKARANLARTDVWAGELMARAEHLSEALDYYRKSTAGFVAVLSILPWDRYSISSLGASHTKTGAGLARMGRLSEAAAEYREALDLTRPLASAKPQNPLPWYVISEACFGLGKLSETAGQNSTLLSGREQQHWTEAHEWYRQAAEAWTGIPNPGVITSAQFSVGNPKQAAHAVARAQVSRRNAFAH